MQAWQKAWREGIAPSLSDSALTSLLTLLSDDDPRLIQGASVVPVLIRGTEDWPIHSGCSVCMAMALGDGLTTVNQVETAFASVCRDATRRLNDPHAAGYFFSWHDETPRGIMRNLLKADVKWVISTRKGGGCAQGQDEDNRLEHGLHRGTTGPVVLGM